MVNVLACFGQFEREVTAERTTAALAYKRSRGERTGGSVPYGFRLADGGQAMQAEGLSLSRMAAALNEEGHLTKQGRPWTHTQVRRALSNGRRFEVAAAKATS